MENLDYIINELLRGHSHYNISDIHENIHEKRKLFRTLLNLQPPFTISEQLLNAQDKELKKQLFEKGIVELNQAKVSLPDQRLLLWQGDITRLNADAIVNAANSQMLGCFIPLHSCIDNAIHSAAGIQMRLECDELMKKKGYPESLP